MMCLSFLCSPWTSLTMCTVPLGSAQDGLQVADLGEHGVAVGIATGERAEEREGDGVGHRPQA